MPLLQLSRDPVFAVTAVVVIFLNFINTVAPLSSGYPRTLQWLVLEFKSHRRQILTFFFAKIKNNLPCR